METQVIFQTLQSLFTTFTMKLLLGELTSKVVNYSKKAIELEDVGSHKSAKTNAGKPHPAASRCGEVM